MNRKGEGGKRKNRSGKEMEELLDEK